MEKLVLLFVYGSLLQGESHHDYVANTKRIAQQAWTKGVLFDTGRGYPCLFLPARKRVYGELYQLNSQQLAQVDRLEDFQPGRQQNLFERVPVKVYTDQGEYEALTYVYSGIWDDRMEVIEEGDWRTRWLAKNEFLYFAYASCMDKERFIEQGVAQEFENISGCGVLTNYALKYTLPHGDGGRADIVEKEKEVVEGKVYRIGRKGLDYLLWREGVQQGVYRPVWLTLSIHNRLVERVLSFVVIYKQAETAPPLHYAQEILRGAKGCVSSSYYNRLQENLRKKFEMTLGEEKTEGDNIRNEP